MDHLICVNAPVWGQIICSIGCHLSLSLFRHSIKLPRPFILTISATAVNYGHSLSDNTNSYAVAITWAQTTVMTSSGVSLWPYRSRQMAQNELVNANFMDGIVRHWRNWSPGDLDSFRCGPSIFGLPAFLFDCWRISFFFHSSWRSGMRLVLLANEDEDTRDSKNAARFRW